MRRGGKAARAAGAESRESPRGPADSHSREHLIPALAGEVRAPLTLVGYHALDDSAARRAGRIEPLAQALARRIARIRPRRALRFGEVSVRDWAGVRRMRRRVYEDSLPALLRELDVHDQDRYDAHSFVFAAWFDGEPVATVRCTTYPFETLRYVEPATVGRYLGPDWERDYIEWGRMALTRAHRGQRLMPALVTYAALRMIFETPYRKYLGYMRETVRARLRGFRVQDESFTFRIPERGEHDYALVRGDVWRDLLFTLPKVVAGRWAAIFGPPRTSAVVGA
jgi:hypothetical protein